jgi:hypothetical protein
MADYHINIFYSTDDKGYIADIPDLQSCSAPSASPCPSHAIALPSIRPPPDFQRL